jgi:hypothetical protein
MSDFQVSLDTHLIGLTKASKSSNNSFDGHAEYGDVPYFRAFLEIGPVGCFLRLRLGRGHLDAGSSYQDILTVGILQANKIRPPGQYAEARGLAAEKNIVQTRPPWGKCL